MKVGAAQIAPVLLDREATLAKVVRWAERAADDDVLLAASGVLQVEDLPADLPARDTLATAAEDGVLHAGGSRLVGPDGHEVAALDEPRQGLLTGQLDRELLLGERQNLDPGGHYHRSDVFSFDVDRRRQRPATFQDDAPAGDA